jgi:hypothetical protein
MMQDPAFQAQMNKVMTAPAFKQHTQKFNAQLKDPKKAKRLELKAKKAIEEGNKLMEEQEKALQALHNEIQGNESQGDEKEPAAPEEAAAPAEEDDIPDIPALQIN